MFIVDSLIDTGFTYKTPYIYGFSLGKDAEVTTDGKYVVYYLGERKEIENKNVEFVGGWDEHGNPKKLTISEFGVAIAGTKGINLIKGEFLCL